MPHTLPGAGTFHPESDDDAARWARLHSFVESEPKAFTRDATIGGHVTGSAFILSHDRSAVLLSLHAKLKIWIQLGGHCDGVADARFTAQREAYEESGLSRVSFMMDTVFDVDIHEIPMFGREPAHLHYDARYLLHAEAGDIAISDESLDLRWIPLKTMDDFTDEPSLLRMRDKALRAI